MDKTNKNKLIKGAVYRMHTSYTEGKDKGKQSKSYLDYACDNVLTGAATIVRAMPPDENGYIGGDWFIGGKGNILTSKVKVVAMSLDEYNAKLPVNEVIVEKEVIVEVKVPQRVNKYEDTWIDALYNWYSKDRDSREFV